MTPWLLGAGWAALGIYAHLLAWDLGYSRSMQVIAILGGPISAAIFFCLSIGRK